MAKFKIGDKVKIARKYQKGFFRFADYMDETIGEVGLIVEVDTSDHTYKVAIQDRGVTFWYLGESLEFVNAQAPLNKIVVVDCDEFSFKQGELTLTNARFNDTTLRAVSTFIVRLGRCKMSFPVQEIKSLSAIDQKLTICYS